MIKNTLIATVVVFLAWCAMDFVLHGMILQSAYASTPALWRPLAEMKMGVLYFAVFIAALAFCWIYARLVSPKNLANGFQLGLWFGIAAGIGMGYGTYAVQPIPYVMALTWFVGHVVESAVAGLIVGAIIKG